MDVCRGPFPDLTSLPAKCLLLQTYGYEHILTLNNLEKAGLLKAQTGGRNNYPTIRKTLRLWMDDVNEQVSSILLVHRDSLHVCICSPAKCLSHCLGVCMCACAHVRTTCRDWFLPSTASVLGLELCLPGLAASPLTPLAFFPALLCFLRLISVLLKSSHVLQPSGLSSRQCCQLGWFDRCEQSRH